MAAKAKKEEDFYLKIGFDVICLILFFVISLTAILVYNLVIKENKEDDRQQEQMYTEDGRQMYEVGSIVIVGQENLLNNVEPYQENESEEKNYLWIEILVLVIVLLVWINDISRKFHSCLSVCEDELIYYRGNLAPYKVKILLKNVTSCSVRQNIAQRVFGTSTLIITTPGRWLFVRDVEDGDYAYKLIMNRAKQYSK